MSTADAVQAATLLALLVLLEGVRRLAGDDVVLCRRLGTHWRVAPPARLGRGFHVVSWLVCFDVPLVLPPVPRGGGDASALDAMRARMERAVGLTRALQVMGTFIAALLVIGVPYAAWRNGAFGFAAAMALLLLGCGLQATLARHALARAGAERPAFFRWLSPFTATRAAGAVHEQVVAGVPRAAAMRELLGEDALLEAYRPALYDLAHGTPHHGADEVAALVGMERVRVFLDAPIRVLAHEGVCARCATHYRADVTECSACGIVLQGAPP